MGTVNAAVAIGDGFESGGGGTFFYTENHLRQRTQYSSLGNGYRMAITFDLGAAGVSQNDNITDCTIELTGEWSWAAGTGVRAEIYCENEDTPTTLESAGTSKILNMNKTTANVSWVQGSLPGGGGKTTTPDISAPVEEVVKRAGWNGEVTVIFWTSTGAPDDKYGSFGSKNHATASYRPTISLTYTNPVVNGNASPEPASVVVTGDEPGVEALSSDPDETPESAGVTVGASGEGLIQVDVFPESAGVTVGSPAEYQPGYRYQTVTGIPIGEGGRTHRMWMPDPTVHPEPERGYPVVIWAHGGSWGAGDSYITSRGLENFLPDNIAYELLDQGYAILSLAYSLSDSVLAQQACDHPTFPYAVKDFNSAHQHLEGWSSLKSGGDGTLPIDSSRVFFGGYSAGSQVAMMAAFSRAVNDQQSYDATENANSYNQISNPNYNGRGGVKGQTSSFPTYGSNWTGSFTYTFKNTLTPWISSRYGGALTDPGNNKLVGNRPQNDISNTAPYAKKSPKGVFLYAPVWDFVSAQNNYTTQYLWGTNVTGYFNGWALRAHFGMEVNFTDNDPRYWLADHEGSPKHYLTPDGTDADLDIYVRHRGTTNNTLDLDTMGPSSYLIISGEWGYSGPADGVAVTTGNSNVDAVILSGTATATSDGDVPWIQGNPVGEVLPVRFETGNTPNSALVERQQTASDNAYSRTFFRTDSESSNDVIVVHRNSAPTQVCLAYLSSNVLYLIDSNDNVRGSVTLPTEVANKWFAVELWSEVNGADTDLTLKVYDEWGEQIGSTQTYKELGTTTQVDSYLFGRDSGGTNSRILWQAEMSTSSTAAIGTFMEVQTPLPMLSFFSDDDGIVPPSFGGDTIMVNDYISRGWTYRAPKTMSTANTPVLTSTDVELAGLTRVKLPAGVDHDTVHFDSAEEDLITWLTAIEGEGPPEQTLSVSAVTEAEQVPQPTRVYLVETPQPDLLTEVEQIPQPLVYKTETYQLSAVTEPELIPQVQLDQVLSPNAVQSTNIIPEREVTRLSTWYSNIQGHHRALTYTPQGWINGTKNQGNANSYITELRAGGMTGILCPWWDATGNSFDASGNLNDPDIGTFNPEDMFAWWRAADPTIEIFLYLSLDSEQIWNSAIHATMVSTLTSFLAANPDIGGLWWDIAPFGASGNPAHRDGSQPTQGFSAGALANLMADVRVALPDMYMGLAAPAAPPAASGNNWSDAEIGSFAYYFDAVSPMFYDYSETPGQDAAGYQNWVATQIDRYRTQLGQYVDIIPSLPAQDSNLPVHDSSIENLTNAFAGLDAATSTINGAAYYWWIDWDNESRDDTGVLAANASNYIDRNMLVPLENNDIDETVGSPVHPVHYDIQNNWAPDAAVIHDVGFDGDYDDTRYVSWVDEDSLHGETRFAWIGQYSNHTAGAAYLFKAYDSTDSSNVLFSLRFGTDKSVTLRPNGTSTVGQVVITNNQTNKFGNGKRYWFTGVYNWENGEVAISVFGISHSFYHTTNYVPVSNPSRIKRIDFGIESSGGLGIQVEALTEAHQIRVGSLLEPPNPKDITLYPDIVYETDVIPQTISTNDEFVEVSAVTEPETIPQVDYWFNESRAVSAITEPETIPEVQIDHVVSVAAIKVNGKLYDELGLYDNGYLYDEPYQVLTPLVTQIESKLPDAVTEPETIPQVTITQDEFPAPDAVTEVEVIPEPNVTQDEFVAPDAVTESEQIPQVGWYRDDAYQLSPVTETQYIPQVRIDQTIFVDAVTEAEQVPQPKSIVIDETRAVSAVEPTGDVIPEPTYSYIFNADNIDIVSETDNIPQPLVYNLENRTPSAVEPTGDIIGQVGIDQTVNVEAVWNPDATYTPVIVTALPELHVVLVPKNPELEVPEPSIDQTVPVSILTETEQVPQPTPVQPGDIVIETPDLRPTRTAARFGLIHIDQSVPPLALTESEQIPQPKVTVDETRAVSAIEPDNTFGTVTINQRTAKLNIVAETDEIPEVQFTVSIRVRPDLVTEAETVPQVSVSDDQFRFVDIVYEDDTIGTVGIDQTINAAAVVSTNRIGTVFIDRAGEGADFFLFFIAGY